MRQGGLILAAGCVRSKKKKRQEKKNTEKKSAPPKTHHEIHSSPATASNSIRHTTKHVPRVSPYSPAFIDPGFVQIGLVPLSQLEITTNLAHTLTDTLTDRLIKRYSSCRYNERQLIDVTVVRRVRPRAECSCDIEGHRRWKRACRTLFCN